MSEILKPLMTDETGQAIVEALTQQEMTQTRIAEINAAAVASKQEIGALTDSSKQSIETKTDEQVARIPEVTKLASDVSSLKDDLDEISVVNDSGNMIPLNKVYGASGNNGTSNWSIDKHGVITLNTNETGAESNFGINIVMNENYAELKPGVSYGLMLFCLEGYFSGSIYVSIGDNKISECINTKPTVVEYADGKTLVRANINVKKGVKATNLRIVPYLHELNDKYNNAYRGNSVESSESHSVESLLTLHKYTDIYNNKTVSDYMHLELAKEVEDISIAYKGFGTYVLVQRILNLPAGVYTIHIGEVVPSSDTYIRIFQNNSNNAIVLGNVGGYRVFTILPEMDKDNELDFYVNRGAVVNSGVYGAYGIKIYKGDIRNQQILPDAMLGLEKIREAINGKISKPPKTQGLRPVSTAEGDVQWTEQEHASSDEIKRYVTEWLNDNPDVVSSVPDNSLSLSKLNFAARSILTSGCICPDEYEGVLTDAERLNRAMQESVATGKEIILNRSYDITNSTAFIEKRETSGVYNTRYPVRIRGGEIVKNDSGYIFSSTIRNCSDIYLENVVFKSVSGSGTCVYDANHIIRIHSTNCQYVNVDHVATAMDVTEDYPNPYAQSIRFIGDTITGGQGYAFDFLGVYDSSFDNITIEHRDSGIRCDTMGHTSGYSMMRVTNSLIENMTGTAISLKNSQSKGCAIISGCYFELNKKNIIVDSIVTDNIHVSDCHYVSHPSDSALIEVKGIIGNVLVSNCIAPSGKVIDAAGVTNGKVKSFMNIGYTPDTGVSAIELI